MIMKTQPLGPFLGINNRKPSNALHVDKVGDFLAAADNVDIDNAGQIRRRSGTSRIVAMANAHSLYMHTETDGFLVRANALYAITLPTYTETLLKVLTSDARMSYQHYGNDDHYYSNGTDSGRITAGVAYPMGLPTPDAPTLTEIGGSLPTGWYQVGVAYVNATTGEEGGISASSNAELTSIGGLRVTLPAATLGATHINVYLSEANGTVPRLHTSVATGTATLDLSTLPTGRPSNGRFESPLPAGTLFAHNGRLCSFAGNTVYVGEAYRPGYYLPLSGYIPFSEPVTIALSNQTGVFIAADKTRYFPGDLDAVAEMISDVLPYGAVPGTAFTVPNKTQWGWFGKHGLVLVGMGSEAKPVMSDNIALTPPALGCSVVLDSGGVRRVASCGWAVNLSNLAATTYSGWDFTSASYLYGTQADGIYLLDTTGTATATVNFGKQDFGTEALKHMPAVYLGVESAAKLSMRIKTPTQDYTYPARAFDANLKMQRVDPGRGLRSNWFELIASNTTGADFKLATVSFAPAPSARRI